MELIVVSGISGSGKSSAIHALEDVGYYCVDNLPASLLAELGQVLARGPHPVADAAVGIDARTRAQFQDLPYVLERLVAEDSTSVRVLFLEANEATLIRRFNETRRRHPLTEPGRSLPEAIVAERKQLAPMAEIANRVVDTSNLSVHTLRRRVRDLVANGANAQEPTLLFQSFGFKYGVPMDSDLVFDLRFLPNPNYEPGLGELSGQDEAVRAFLDNLPELAQRLQEISNLLTAWLPAYRAEPRSYLTISLGCTGGRHRSVHMAERLADNFRNRIPVVQVRHRDLGGDHGRPSGRR